METENGKSGTYARDNTLIYQTEKRKLCTENTRHFDLFVIFDYNFEIHEISGVFYFAW